MTESLLSWLIHLSGEDWERRPAGIWEGRPETDASVVSQAEVELGVRVPEDYRTLLLESDGGALAGPNETMNLEWVEDLVDRNNEQRFEEGLPEMLVIGDNGGGAVYFYDPGNRLGHGAWCVYWVNLGDLDLANARLAGRSLTETLHRIAGGISYFNRPKIG